MTGPDTPGGPPPRSRVGEVKVTTTAPAISGGRADVPPPRGLLLLGPDATPAQLSEAAGRLRLPMSALSAIVSEGHAVPVQSGLRRGELKGAEDQLALPVTGRASPGPVLPIAAGATGVLGLGGVVLGLVLAVFTLGLSLALSVVGGLAMLAALVMAGVWVGGLVGYSAHARRSRDLSTASATWTSHPLVGGVRAHLADVRLRLADAAHLPEVAASDIRDALGSLEEGLERLANRHDVGEEGLEDEVGRARDGLERLEAQLVERPGEDVEDVIAAVDRAVEAATLGAEAHLDAARRSAAARQTREPR